LVSLFIISQSCFAVFVSATYTELAGWSLALNSLLYLLETTEERAELFVSDASPA